MAFVYQQGSGLAWNRGLPFDDNRCAASVSDNQRFPRFHQCRRSWALEENGYKWCKTHAPSTEKARQDESMRRYQASINNSPAVRLGHEARRRRELEEAIDNFLAGRITPGELGLIRENKGYSDGNR